MRLLLLLSVVLILTGSVPAAPGPYDNHPVLRLFSREKKEEAKSNTEASTKKQEETYLQIWTGTGTIAQQNKFLFSEKTTIDPNRKNLNWWFRLKTDNEPAFVIWQVTDTPFNDASLLWKEPQGLVASGPAITLFGLGNAKLFEIEFEEIVNRQPGKSSTANTTYYIRVIALDASGEPAGPPSNTVTAHYGLHMQ